MRSIGLLWRLECIGWLVVHKVYIFYPSKIVGGAEFLLKRVSELISQSCKVEIIDIEGGWLSRNVEENSGVSVSYLHSDKKILLPDDAILITPASLIRVLDVYFEPSCARLLFWVVQPYNVVPVFPLFRNLQRNNAMVGRLVRRYLLGGEYSFYKRVLEQGISKASVYGMDQETNEVLKQHYGLEYSGYLPVVIDEASFSLSEVNVADDSARPLSAVWLGRLDLEFKFNILCRVIEDLNSVSEAIEKPIILRIIGDGPGRAALESLCRKKKHLKVDFIGELLTEDLHREIAKCDLGFAMGTSAIELAAKGVPTILLDFSYGYVDGDYRYRWFYESSSFTLGRSIDRYTDKSCGNSLKMEDVCSQVLVRRKDFRSKCYYYALKNHSSVVLYAKLMDALASSELSIACLYRMGLENKPFWYAVKKALSRVMG
jgi:hypothetical protein